MGYPITLTTTNGIGSPVTQAFTLTVYQAPTLSSGATDTVDEGVSIAPFTVNYAGYPAPALKATGLPKGLTMVNNDNGTATISGTPMLKDAGNYTTTIAAGSKAGTASETIAFTVDSSPVFKSKGVTLTHTTVAFSYPVTTVYAFPAPTITTTSTLPDGVSLVDNGNGTANGNSHCHRRWELRDHHRGQHRGDRAGDADLHPDGVPGADDHQRHQRQRHRRSRDDTVDRGLRRVPGPGAQGDRASQGPGHGQQRQRDGDDLGHPRGHRRQPGHGHRHGNQQGGNGQREHHLHHHRVSEF